MQNPGKLLKTIMDMQSKMDAVQKELAETNYDGSSANGLVTVKVSGKGEVSGLVIDPEVLSEDAETVADLVTIAINNASSKKEALAKEKLAKLSSGLMPLGLKLPGLG